MLQRLEHWYEGQDYIGDLMHLHAPKMAPYARFGSHYNESLKKVEALGKSNSTWRKALEELDENVKALDGLTLSSYLIMPIQRLPRYNLLIRDLLKQTPDTHKDFRLLTEAGKSVSDVADKLNEKIRENESNVPLPPPLAPLSPLQLRLLQFMERKGGFERLPQQPKAWSGQRLWMREDELVSFWNVSDAKDKAPKGKEKLELIMFNDMLVFGPYVSKKAAPQDYHQPTRILWVTKDVSQDFLRAAQVDEGDYERFTAALSVVGPENHWLLGFQNMAKRNQWLNDLESVMKLSPNVDVGSGLRVGIYEFRNPKLGQYEGEWDEGWMHGKGTLTAGQVPPPRPPPLNPSAGELRRVLGPPVQGGLRSGGGSGGERAGPHGGLEAGGR